MNTQQRVCTQNRTQRVTVHCVQTKLCTPQGTIFLSAYFSFSLSGSLSFSFRNHWPCNIQSCHWMSFPICCHNAWLHTSPSTRRHNNPQVLGKGGKRACRDFPLYSWTGKCVPRFTALPYELYFGSMRERLRDWCVFKACLISHTGVISKLWLYSTSGIIQPHASCSNLLFKMTLWFNIKSTECRVLWKHLTSLFGLRAIRDWAVTLVFFLHFSLCEFGCIPNSGIRKKAVD